MKTSAEFQTGQEESRPIRRARCQQRDNQSTVQLNHERSTIPTARPQTVQGLTAEYAGDDKSSTGDNVSRLIFALLLHMMTTVRLKSIYE